MRKSQWLKRLVVTLGISLIFSAGNTFAVDEATVQQIQEDAAVAKNKADENATEIQSLKGGLPTERNERIIADADLQGQIDALEATSSGSGTSLIDSNGDIIGSVIDHSAYNAKVLYKFHDGVSGESFNAILMMEKDGIEIDNFNKPNLYYNNDTCQGQAYMKSINLPGSWEGFAKPRVGFVPTAPASYVAGNFIKSYDPDFQGLGNRNTLWYPDTSALPITIYASYSFILYSYGYICYPQGYVYNLYPAQSYDLESDHPTPYEISY